VRDLEVELEIQSPRREEREGERKEGRRKEGGVRK